MVICYYFQRGACHFGSQCRNEHISSHNRPGMKSSDMRAVVVAEAEAVITGKQWIFSCYAPFRDKLGVIIPQFIEDVSTEEMRWECYQAKAQAAFAEYTNSLSLKEQEATRKMKMLLSPSTEVVNFLMDLYNETLNASTKNPFSSSGQTDFGKSNSSNIFAQTSNSAQTNIFGGASTAAYTSNNFGQMNANVFSTPSQIASSNIFTSNNANANVFQQANTFTNTSNPAPANMNIFARAASDFGQNTGSGTSAVNAFSFSVPQPNNIFGGNAPVNTNPTFGQPPNLGTNIFAAGNAALGNNSNEQGSVFGQPATLSSNIFASAALPNSGNTKSNVFGNVEQDMGSFGSLSDSNKENVFGNNTNINLFKSDSQTNAFNVFQKESQPNSGDNPFLQKNDGINVPFTGYIFKGIDESVYSKREDLTEQEIAAYDAEEFTFGNIPVEPPTRDMCFD